MDIAVLAWTVNSRTVLQKLDGLGVDGVITDDPRIFGKNPLGATLQA